MRRIQSFLISIVMSILLTQAVDPPYQDKTQRITEHQLINRLLQSNGRSQYARLLQREEIQPLLKLYDSNNNFSRPQVLEEHPDIIQDQGKIDKLLRRNDNTYTFDEEDKQLHTHVTELLKRYNNNKRIINNYKNSPAPSATLAGEPQQQNEQKHPEVFKPSTLLSIEQNKKKYDFNPDVPLGPIARQTAPGEYDARFQPYEPDQFYPQSYGFAPEQPRFDPFGENFADPRYHRFRYGFRSPRKLPQRERGNRELFQAEFGPSGRDAYYEHGISPWKGSWRARGPRVIFPTDLVSFREQQEPDFLAGDQSLQELQEPEREPDRGEFSVVELLRER